MTRRLEAVCGTVSGYKKHLRHEQEPCEPCREAKKVENAERYAHPEYRRKSIAREKVRREAAKDLIAAHQTEFLIYYTARMAAWEKAEREGNS